MDNFDNLTNDEIRIRLIENGLPNLPVTSTTRSVLLKKLRLLSNTKSSIGKGSSKRRETIAVSKFSSDEDESVKDLKSKRATTPNKRATIIAVEKVRTTVVEQQPLTPSKSKPPRRSSRSTPVQDKPMVSSSNIVSIDEDTDEDIVEEPKMNRSRSKTPLLAKSDTVRTSYETKIEAPRTYESHMESDETDEEYTKSTVSGYPKINDKDETSISTHYRDKFSSNLQNRKTITTSTNDAPYKSLYSDIRKPISSSLGYSRQSLSTYNYGDVEDKEIETNAPYLSKFSQRLSSLKPEPLETGMDKYHKLRNEPETPSETIYKYQPSSQNIKYNFRKERTTYVPIQYKTQKKSLSQEFVQVFESLDRQYNIRKIFCIILIIFLVVAIYLIVS